MITIFFLFAIFVVAFIFWLVWMLGGDNKSASRAAQETRQAKDNGSL